MKLKIIILCLLFVLVGHFLYAQKYTYENKHLIASAEFDFRSNDSIYANIVIDLTNKADSIFFVSNESACYMDIVNSTMYLYIGWDQNSTVNTDLALGPILSKNNKATYVVSGKRKINSKVDTVVFQINYLLCKDFFSSKSNQNKGLLAKKKNFIQTKEYFKRMEWAEFKFPFVIPK